MTPWRGTGNPRFGSGRYSWPAIMQGPGHPLSSRVLHDLAAPLAADPLLEAVAELLQHEGPPDGPRLEGVALDGPAEALVGSALASALAPVPNRAEVL